MLPRILFIKKKYAIGSIELCDRVWFAEVTVGPWELRRELRCSRAHALFPATPLRDPTTRVRVGA